MSRLALDKLGQCLRPIFGLPYTFARVTEEVFTYVVGEFDPEPINNLVALYTGRRTLRDYCRCDGDCKNGLKVAERLVLPFIPETEEVSTLVPAAPVAVIEATPVVVPDPVPATIVESPETVYVRRGGKYVVKVPERGEQAYRRRQTGKVRRYIPMETESWNRKRD